MATKKATRKRRDFQEIARLIEEFDGSGLTAAQFARRKGVSISAIYHWKRLAREERRSQAVLEPIEIIAFPPLPDAPFAEPRAGSGVVLRLPSGVECCLDPEFDAGTLVRVMEILHRSGH